MQCDASNIQYFGCFSCVGIKYELEPTEFEKQSAPGLFCIVLFSKCMWTCVSVLLVTLPSAVYVIFTSTLLSIGLPFIL